MQTEPTRWTTEELLSQAEWLGALARRLVSDPIEADDVAQDTWTAALRRPPERDRPLRPWLARVARNFARMRGRKAAARASFDDAADTDAGPEELSARLEAQRMLLDAVSELREPYRSTVLLAYFEHRSSEEIAERHGVSAGTVRWRLKTAVDELRDRLDRAHEGRRGAWAVTLAPLLRSDSAAATVAAGAWQGVFWIMPLLKLGSAAVLVGVVLYFAFDILSPDPERVAVTSDEPLHVEFAPIHARDIATAEPAEVREAASSTPASTSTAAEQATAAAVVEARFVDEAGEPIAGVELRSVRGEFIGSPRVDCDREGHASLALELRSESANLVLHAGAPGWATQAARILARRGETAHLGTLTLARGGDISGRVVDGTGAPIASAKVGRFESRLPDSETWHARIGEDEPFAMTDAEGGFVLRGAPAGEARLVAEHENYVSTISRRIEVRTHQESRGVVLVLAPIADENCIAGIVLDPDGIPAPFASVAFSYRSPPASGSGSGSGAVVTESDGRFRILVNHGAVYVLTASDFGGRHGAVEIGGVETGTVDVVLRLLLKRELVVRARTRDGRAIERFRADALEPEAGRSGGSTGEGPHADGIARFVPQTARFELEVRADGFALGRAGPFDAVPTEPVCFELDPLPGVRGRVTHAGTPVTGARIEAFRRGNGRFARNGLAMRFERHEQGRTTTSTDGAFTLTLRDADDFVLLVVADGFATAELALEGFAPDRGRDGLAIELLRGGSIEGRVFAPAGSDVAGTIVAFSRGDGRGFTKRVGPDGTYRADNLTPGRWHVMEHVAEIDAERVRSTSSLYGAASEPPENCTVVDGQVTHFDLGGQLECELSVRVLVDGVPAVGWSVAAETGRMRATRPDPGVSVLDREGRARVAPRELGPGFVVITAIGGELDGLRIVRRMEYAVGGAAIELDLRTARARVEGATVETPLCVVTLLAGDDFAVRPVTAAGSSEFAVLAGSVRLWRYDASLLDRDPRTWRALDAAEVQAGGSASLRER